MQILIDIPDTLPLEELNQLIVRIESQLQTETYAIKLEGKPSLDISVPSQNGMQRFLDWCDRHKVTVDNLIIPSREERNAR